MKRQLLFSSLLIFLITYALTSGAQQSDKTNRKKVQKQKLETWALITRHVLRDDPDSALTFYTELIPDFYHVGCLWAAMGRAYYYNYEIDQACFHYYIADEFGHESTKHAVHLLNCQSWQNEWIKLADQYEEPESYDFNEAFIRKNPFSLLWIKENEWYSLLHRGEKIEVKFIRMKNYVFGQGLHFVTKDGTQLFKVYHADFPETIRILKQDNDLVKK